MQGWAGQRSASAAMHQGKAESAFEVSSCSYAATKYALYQVAVWYITYKKQFFLPWHYLIEHNIQPTLKLYLVNFHSIHIGMEGKK